ncbi:hypothetical protein PR048_001162 [Dryococelus australis]|uniref:Small ribosomal subunit protein uS10 domain-containing protein n=1 Tax=Dryococelus australis TaxID=614101 RepID=A0ABQ9IHX8_9NEOP|nr:hypothetical protein PR048_001162 [Dryococelus australis]
MSWHCQYVKTTSLNVKLPTLQWFMKITFWLLWRTIISSPHFPANITWINLLPQSEESYILVCQTLTDRIELMRKKMIFFNGYRVIGGKLDKLKPDIPVYNTLNIQIKGYDFPVLENYQKFVHGIAEAMEIEVEDSWAVPPQHLQIQKFKPRSSIVDSEYKLLVYERNVQITDLPSTVASVFFEVIQAVLPEGVSLSIHEHLKEHDDVRFVPDQQLKELKTELDSLGGPLKKK